MNYKVISVEKSSISNFFAENIFSRNEVQANKFRKTVNLAGFDEVSAIQPNFVLKVSRFEQPLFRANLTAGRIWLADLPCCAIEVLHLDALYTQNCET
jgi:hypothetical protein